MIVIRPPLFETPEEVNDWCADRGLAEPKMFMGPDFLIRSSVMIEDKTNAIVARAEKA